VWQVRFHPEARKEERELPAREKLAMANAIDKLRALGPALPYPHSSDVRGADRLRELRPRAGRSPWRALYRRVGDVMVIAASPRKPRWIRAASTVPPTPPKGA